MSKQLRELASALMDGEADERELHTLSQEDREMIRDSWRSYHQVSSALKSEAIPFAEWDISDSVKRQLSEQHSHDSLKKSFSRWLRPIGTLAVATSVTLVIVFGTNNLNTIGTTGYPLLSTNDQNSGGSVDMNPTNTSDITLTTPTQAMGQPMSPRLQGYTVRHTYNTPLNNNHHIAMLAKTAYLGAE